MTNRERLNNMTDEDMVYRQAVIDDIDEWIEIYGKNKCVDAQDILKQVKRSIKKLPSAQPTLTCDGCRHVGTYDTEFPCNGCIRREKDYYETDR